LDIWADPDAYTHGVRTALEGGAIRQERERSAKALDRSRSWLKVTLSQTVTTFRKELDDLAQWQETQGKREDVLRAHQEAQDVITENKVELVQQRFLKVAENKEDIEREIAKKNQSMHDADQARDARIDLYRRNRHEEIQNIAARNRAHRRSVAEEERRLFEEERRTHASSGRMKDARAETVLAERREIHEAQSYNNAHAAEARKVVRRAISQQRVACAYDADKIGTIVQALANDPTKARFLCIQDLPRDEVRALTWEGEPCADADNNSAAASKPSKA
jgi:hypothetical protein